MQKQVAMVFLLISGIANAGGARVFIDGVEVDYRIPDPRSTPGYGLIKNESTGKAVTLASPYTPSTKHAITTTPLHTTVYLPPSESTPVPKEECTLPDVRGVSFMEEIRANADFKRCLRLRGSP